MDAMLLLKVSLLLSATLLAARLLSRAPAITRHRLWTVAFAALLSLPVLPAAVPALRVPVPALFDVAMDTGTSGAMGQAEGRIHLTKEAIAVVSAATESEPAANGVGVTTDDTAGFDARHLLNGSTLLLAAWLAGTAFAAAALILSLGRARRLARTADEMCEPAWRSTADALGTKLGLRRPTRLLLSRAVTTPMAGGLWRPVIFLPESARTWNAEHRDVVLAHELAHLAGCDPVRHVLARLAVALYWFHPLAWLAARQATVAREQACDEAVLALGTRPSAYARVLLDLAESIRPSAAPLGALPMVERSLLEARLMAILRDDTRHTTRTRGLIPAIGVVLLTLSVAAAQPVAPAYAPNVASTPSDPPEPSVEPMAVSAAATQPGVDRDSACWWNVLGGTSFSGSISTSNAAGRTVIYEQIGTRGGDRIIEKSFGDLRLCMLAEGVGNRAGGESPSQWLGRAPRVIMEARRGGTLLQRLAVERQAGGVQRNVWQVGSAARPFDAAAERWRDRMLAVFDTTWELSTLRGEVSSLRGAISSIRGEQSSLRGEISSLQGEVSSMRGRASSIRGEESSLRGEISSIRGHVSSLRGAISSERGAVSSLNADWYRAADPDRARRDTRIREHEAEIARIEQAIRDYNADAKIAAVERQIEALDAAGKVASVEAEIRAFDLNGKVAAVERRIAALDVAGKTATIERQIEALDADRRGRQLEERRESQLKELEAVIAATGAVRIPSLP